MDDLTLAKIITALINVIGCWLFASPTIGWGLLKAVFCCICFRRKDKESKKNGIGCNWDAHGPHLTSFATGAVIGGAMIHLLPDAEQQMDDYFNGDDHYAWTQLMATSTFLLLIFVDTLAHMVDQKKKMLILMERGPRHANCPSTCTSAVNSLASSVSNYSNVEPINHNPNTTNPQTTQASTLPTEANGGTPTPLYTRTASFTYGASDYNENSAKNLRKINSVNDLSSMMIRENSDLMASITDGVLKSVLTEEEKPLLKGRKRKRHQSAKMSCLIFIGALSFHSVLEGIGIGAADDAQSFYGLLSAIMAHKFIEAFVAGLLIKKAGFTDLHESLLALIYAVMTPIGIIVSMMLGAFLDSYPLVPAVFLSCGCGSFMFVGFWEMLNQSLDTKKVEKNLFLGQAIYWELSKRFLWIFVGFITMASFAIFD